MVNILDLFRKSPFEPLHEHMLKVKGCIVLIKPLFEAFIKEDEDKIKKLVKQISKTEHQADDIKNEIRRTLPKRLFLPVSREDILRYLKLQDGIADSVEDISLLLTLKKIKVPESVKDDLLKYIDKVVEVCNFSDEATDHLKTLADVGFGGPEADLVFELIDKAEHAEWESDTMEISLARKLFKLESQMSPIDIFLWFKIFGELGTLANAAEKTADAFRIMLIGRK